MTEAVTATPGRRLAARYILHERLGVGGQGEVWRAHDPERGVDIALKILQPSPGRAADAWAALLNEHESASHLDHPGILKVYPPERDCGDLLLPMELAAGGDLRRLRAADASAARGAHRADARQERQGAGGVHARMYRRARRRAQRHSLLRLRDCRAAARSAATRAHARAEPRRARAREGSERLAGAADSGSHRRAGAVGGAAPERAPGAHAPRADAQRHPTGASPARRARRGRPRRLRVAAAVRAGAT